MDTAKLALLLENPETRAIVYGLGHVYPAPPSASGPQRLRAALHQLLDTADPVQAESWLSDEAANHPITAAQMRAAFGDEVIGDLARRVGSEPDEVAWQLTVVLPDLVDAFSPDGVIVDEAALRDAFFAATEAGDRSAGAFAPHTD